MAKEKPYFVFHCPDGADAFLARLEREVRLLTDRDYLLETTEGGFRLGIVPGNHGCGYWYCATVEAVGSGCRISGRIEYLHGNGEPVDLKWRWFDWIEYALFVIFLSPVIIPYRIYRLFRPEVTMEEQFEEFMTGSVGCSLIESK